MRLCRIVGGVRSAERRPNTLRWRVLQSPLGLRPWLAVRGQWWVSTSDQVCEWIYTPFLLGLDPEVSLWIDFAGKIEWIEPVFSGTPVFEHHESLGGLMANREDLAGFVFQGRPRLRGNCSCAEILKIYRAVLHQTHVPNEVFPGERTQDRAVSLPARNCYSPSTSRSTPSSLRKACTRASPVLTTAGSISTPVELSINQSFASLEV